MRARATAGLLLRIAILRRTLLFHRSGGLSDMHFRATGGVAAFVVMVAASSAVRADEGMWTFDAFPTAKVKAAYGWAPDQPWLDRVQASAVRLTGGCSASFVSRDGLMLTNHHCV